MRMMLRVNIPVDRGNTTFSDGSLQKTVEATMGKLKPEAAYFYPSDGQRTAVFYFNLVKESDIVGVVEPLWHDLEADIELLPVMNVEDLAAGMQSMA